VGECSADGVTVCSGDGTGVACNAVPGDPATETCDGLDNDCDGATDNGFDLGAACTAGQGECQASGVTICSADGTTTTCTAVPGTPGEETCDGLDNDCDGAVDNAAPPGGFVQNLTVYEVAGVTHVTWDAVPGATRYDLIKGSLVNLQSSSGNFTSSTNTCVANDTPDTDVAHPVGPAPGFGFYYLVRPVNCGGNGSYNSGHADQVGLRDAEIAASGYCQ
jgi:hypothetical protein